MDLLSFIEPLVCRLSAYLAHFAACLTHNYASANLCLVLAYYRCSTVGKMMRLSVPSTCLMIVLLLLILPSSIH